MKQFSYDAYAEALRALAQMPETIQRQQDALTNQRSEANKKLRLTTKAEMDILEQAASRATEQFDAIALEYKALFGRALSRPSQVPTPLTWKDTITAQNAIAQQLKALFSDTKAELILHKQKETEQELVKQKEMARLAKQRKEEEARKAQMEQERKEEALRKALEYASKSKFRKLIDAIVRYFKKA